MALFDDPALQATLQVELERTRFYTRETKILEQIILETVTDEPLFELL